MSISININGKIWDKENAKISVFDRGFLYGDSIYEATYSQKRTFVFLDEHLDRLWNSAALIGMEIQISRLELAKRILETAKASNLDEVFVRVVITRGETELILNPENSAQNVVIYVKPNIQYPQSFYEKGFSLSLVGRPRNDRRSLDPNAKSGNYLNNILAIQEAKKTGADDAIMANTQGEVTEGTTFNVWMVRDGEVFTPHHDSGLLKGITRDKVMDVCAQLKVPFHETSLTAADLSSAQELFITSSTKGIMPVYKLDDRIYAETDDKRPVTEKLRKRYLDLVNEHIHQGLFTY
ncbi:MAG: aminotransferase class IV [Bacteriovoracaceae bacterium]